MTTITSDETAVLQMSPLFDRLTDKGLLFVVSRCHRRVVPAGQTIMTEGEPGGSMLIIVSGRVEYRRGHEVLGSDAAGSFFGEIALITGSDATRAASVVALEDCILLEMHRADFEVVVRRHPSVSLAAVRAMATRLKTIEPVGLFRSKSTVAIVGVLSAIGARILSRYLPPELATQASAALIQAASEYAVPMFAGLAMLLKHREVKAVRRKLLG